MTTVDETGSLFNYKAGFFTDLANNQTSEANRKGVYWLQLTVEYLSTLLTLRQLGIVCNDKFITYRGGGYPRGRRD